MDRGLYKQVSGKAKKTEVLKLKRNLKHIIRKLTDWKDFVFADPLLPCGTIGKPMHIAYICKSHVPTHNRNLQKSAIYSLLNAATGNQNGKFEF